MAAVLTPSLYRPPLLIDLTGDDPLPPPTSRYQAVPEASPAAFLDDPAPAPARGSKRRRLESSPPVRPAPPTRERRSRSQCLKEQVYPLIFEQVQDLPREKFRREEIIGEVAKFALADTRFQRDYDAKQGWLSEVDLVPLRARLAKEVWRLAALPKYHHAPPTPTSNSRPSASATPQKYHAPSPRKHYTASPRQAPSTPPRAPATPAVRETPETPARRPILNTGPRMLQRRHLHPVSPKNYRSQARARALRTTPADKEAKKPTRGDYFSLGHRPYLKAEDREKIHAGTRPLVRLPLSELQRSFVYHVDFTELETEVLRSGVRAALRKEPSTRNAIKDLRRLAMKDEEVMRSLPYQLEKQLSRRKPEDIYNFLGDVCQKTARTDAQMLRLERDPYDRQDEAARTSRIPSLLLAREVEGNRGYGRMRTLCNFANQFRQLREDNLELQCEWTNCAGDIATVSWVGNHKFICGTTAHSDSRNQQYNKAGNLLLGSSTLGTLRAYPDHRIVRPIVFDANNSNSTDAMRESQDPWLYSSVVSSDYDATHDRAFTSSFDRTVKVWKVDGSGQNMAALGTWEHTGNVNFVVASRHPTGLVATAADVPSDAVRVYHVDEGNVSGSPYRSYSCTQDQDQGPSKWAFFPATMQWGRCEGVRHLLLVGYSPRSFSWDDNDIPEDKRESGEMCLWDCLTGERIKIPTATTQNVFEVAWHPTQPSFIVATSPCGPSVDEGVRTQIRIFRPSDNTQLLSSFTAVKCLDCVAEDINELTIMPNSFTYCYITAAGTDGTVYVWDTALSDKPVHELRHGPPVLGSVPGRERDDTGVKFTAWGGSIDRFYSGSSDGVVKIWNVRNPVDPLVRDLLEVPAEVVCGAFSPDASKLAIGDATGRVYLLSLDPDDRPAPATRQQFVNLPQAGLVRRPRPFIPHPEPAPPARDGLGRPLEPQSGAARAAAWLRAGALRLARDPTVGAVQGPRYGELGLRRRDAHLGGDAGGPLLAGFEKAQQENGKMWRRGARLPALRPPAAPPSEAAAARHRANVAADLDLRALDEVARMELMMGGVDLSDAEAEEDDYGFAYEELPEEMGWETDSERDSDPGDEGGSDDDNDSEDGSDKGSGN